MSAAQAKKQAAEMIKALAAHGMNGLSSVDHVVVRAADETWWIVYRTDSYGTKFWDLFSDQQAPPAGKYKDQISDNLMSTDDVVNFLRLRNRPDVAAVLTAIESARNDVAYERDYHHFEKGHHERADMDHAFDMLRETVIKIMELRK